MWEEAGMQWRPSRWRMERRFCCKVIGVMIRVVRGEGKVLVVVMWNGRYVEFSILLVGLGGLDGLDLGGRGRMGGKADGDRFMMLVRLCVRIRLLRRELMR